MTHQRCLATHLSNPPEALGGRRLCERCSDRLTDALTGPSAATDLTVEAVWGYISGYSVVICTDRQRAIEGRETALRAWIKRLDRAAQQPQRPDLIEAAGPRPGPVVCGDGTRWYNPRDYRPGDIARDWAALQLRDKSIRTGEPAPYVSNGAAEAPLPIDAAVADIRLRIEHAITYWIAEHIDRQQLVQPDLATIHQAITWLARHLDWATRQDFAGKYVDNLRDLHNSARSVIDLPQPRTFDVGPCICIVDGRRCHGTLRTIARDARDPTPPVIKCSDCPAAYDSTRWKSLGKRLYEQSA